MSRLTEVARVSDNCAAMATEREGLEIQGRGTDYLEELGHHFLQLLFVTVAL